MGAIVDAVPREAQGWASSLLDRFDGGVAVSHCHWTDSTFVDLLVVRGACDEVGAALVVDATQSPGPYPFDVVVVRPDFLVAAAYKWLRSPQHGLPVDRHAPTARRADLVELGRGSGTSTGS